MPFKDGSSTYPNCHLCLSSNPTSWSQPKFPLQMSWNKIFIQTMNGPSNPRGSTTLEVALRINFILIFLLTKEVINGSKWNVKTSKSRSQDIPRTLHCSAFLMSVLQMPFIPNDRFQFFTGCFPFAKLHPCSSHDCSYIPI